MHKYGNQLIYNPITGDIFNVNDEEPRSPVGNVQTGGPNRSKAYRKISINGKSFYHHRVAWALYYGDEPSGEIDHIDGNGLNNSISNLRVVSRVENMRNTRLSKRNKSGRVGVFYYGKTRCWIAQIKVKGKCIFLGHFGELIDAVAARIRAEKKYGFHENHGLKLVRPDIEDI
jgi:hypothetical protein